MSRLTPIFQSPARLIPATWIASVALHALVLVPFAWTASAALQRDIFDEGMGQDAFKVTMEPVQAQVEVQAVTPPVLEKQVDPQLKQVISSTESPFELVRAEDLPPPPDAAAAAAQEEAPQSAYEGGKATVKANTLSAYVDKIHSALRSVKLGRRVKGTGKVIVGFRIDGAGRVKSPEVLESSGVAAIDKAAVDMLAKANFPPLPDALGREEYFKVPFTFSS